MYAGEDHEAGDSVHGIEQAPKEHGRMGAEVCGKDRGFLYSDRWHIWLEAFLVHKLCPSLCSGVKISSHTSEEWVYLFFLNI